MLGGTELSRESTTFPGGVLLGCRGCFVAQYVINSLANSVRISYFRPQLAAVQEDRRCATNSQLGRRVLIGLNSQFHLLAVHITNKASRIQTKVSGKLKEDGSRVDIVSP